MMVSSQLSMTTAKPETTDCDSVLTFVSVKPLDNFCWEIGTFFSLVTGNKIRYLQTRCRDSFHSCFRQQNRKFMARHWDIF